NEQRMGRKLAATTLKQCLAKGGARTAFPGTSEYSTARLAYNLRERYAPSAFVFPTTVAQVQNAVFCAKQVGVGIVPRGGGHSYEDYSLGGRDGVLVVDMEGFKQFSYNKAAKTAVVGAGFRLGPLYLALWNAGKVTIPAGNCPTVGIAGHALGGGWGFSSRKFGLVTDNILEVQLVAANGTVVTANAQKNKDLYFAIRGAGATSYGIVTQFTFRVHDVSAPVTHFKYRWNDKAVLFKNFKSFQSWGLNVPAEISAAFYMDPSGVSWLEGTYLGKKTSLLPLVKTFLASAAPNPTRVEEELNWIQLILVNWNYPSNTNPNQLNNVPFTTNTFKAKSIYVNGPGLSDAGINAMINAMNTGSNAYFIYDLYGSQSAINKVVPGETAFIHRNSLYSIQMVASWSNDNNAVTQTSYITRYWKVVRTYATGQAYQNYIDRDMPLSAYYGSSLSTLIAGKKKWDPQNVFNFPQSIPLKHHHHHHHH
uniref:PpBBE-like 1 n=1 Tax=Physcomitrium patens TaxID=3218 RepID=UPI000D1D1454|nr:Chain A, PpBBE-like 1 [Physcomitrium patens]6EO4_B Chain B, PpBBE-like 1 [Physcomitrium patens]